MTFPTVHLNGTSGEELRRQYSEVYKAIDAAIDAAHEAAPNGRDYYVRGNDALEAATTEHMSRILRLKEVRDEFLAIYVDVDGQTAHERGSDALRKSR